MSDVKNDKEYLQDGEYDLSTAMDNHIEASRIRAERQRTERVTAPAEKSEQVFRASLSNAAADTIEFIKQNNSIIRKSMNRIDGYEMLLRGDLAIYDDKEGDVTPEELKNLISDIRLTYEETYGMLVRLMCRANAVCDMTFLADYLEGGEDEFIEKTIAEPEGIRCSAEPRCVMLKLPLLPKLGVFDTVVFSGKKMLRASEANLFGRQIELVLGRELEKKGTELRVFSKVIISYLYVYPDGISAADNDKPNTSKITNAICRSLHTCDSPECCWFTHSALETDELPAGTYVTVTPMEDGFAATMKAAERWKKILANQE